ncbi:hypothetical protein [Natronoglomus mannanivorans]|uniref:Uncharacterized protein n=1 Tax=Natronoglomus mannanivorans TaxID=2979990 RepID=A0AAP3E3T7_9EURY|nr:hypothetical protein [Halobacteria archaeon AArc-xg1-1]
MPAISFLFVLFLLVQTLLAYAAFRLARRREDAAVALGVLVFAGGVIGLFVLESVLEALAVQLLCLGLYAFISKPRTTRRRPHRQ